MRSKIGFCKISFVGHPCPVLVSRHPLTSELRANPIWLTVLLLQFFRIPITVWSIIKISDFLFVTTEARAYTRKSPTTYDHTIQTLPVDTDAHARYTDEYASQMIIFVYWQPYGIQKTRRMWNEWNFLALVSFRSTKRSNYCSVMLFPNSARTFLFDRRNFNFWGLLL